MRVSLLAAPAAPVGLLCSVLLLLGSLTLPVVVSGWASITTTTTMPHQFQQQPWTNVHQSTISIHNRASVSKFNSRSRSFTQQRSSGVILHMATTPTSKATTADTDNKKSTRIAFSGDDLIPVLDDSSYQKAASRENTVDNDWIEGVLSSYWGPRVILAVIAAIYGTNFALGSLMNASLPAAAVTTCRMTLAAAALLPFLPRISPQLRNRAILCGFFTAAGYVAQSLALTDTDPARVSFLGAATVIWCPLLEWGVDRVPMGWRDAPQTWIAALLCLTGVGILELYDPSGAGMVSVLSMDTMGGDVLALLQAVAFGTGCFLNGKMIREEPDQVLPVTAVLIAVTAALAWLWCGVESYMTNGGALIFDPAQLILDPALRPVALAVLWTGLVSTAFNVVVEISALGRLPSSEASVLLASEPIWAALFAAGLLGETLQGNDYVGGAFIIAACLVNAVVKPNDLKKLLAWNSNSDNNTDSE